MYLCIQLERQTFHRQNGSMSKGKNGLGRNMPHRQSVGHLRRQKATLSLNSFIFNKPKRHQSLGFPNLEGCQGTITIFCHQIIFSSPTLIRKVHVLAKGTVDVSSCAFPKCQTFVCECSICHTLLIIIPLSHLELSRCINTVIL